jgi:hypothetical protein
MIACHWTVCQRNREIQERQYHRLDVGLVSSISSIHISSLSCLPLSDTGSPAANEVSGLCATES